jgi:hypothetical protein
MPFFAPLQPQLFDELAEFKRTNALRAGFFAMMIFAAALCTIDLTHDFDLKGYSLLFIILSAGFLTYTPSPELP